MPQPDGKGMGKSTANRLYSPIMAGLFNAPAGLRNWAQARSTARIPGGGGIDVALIGDSLIESYQCWTDSATWRTNRLGLELARLLQSRLNPDDVLGGYGLIPIYAGDSGPQTIIWTLGGVENATNPNGQGLCARNQTLDAGANRYSLNIDGLSSSATAQKNRTLVTDVEFVGRKGTAVGAYRYDISTGALPAIGAGTVTGTMGTGAPNTYGNHFGVVNLGAVLPGSSNYFSFAAAAAGNQTFPDGAIFYNGDKATGVRVHDMSNTGTSADSYSAANTRQALLQFAATADTDTATTGASRMKLCVSNFGMNDLDPSSPLDTATYIANLRALYTPILDSAQAPSRPSLIHWSEFPRGGVNGATQQTYYNTALPLIKALAVELGFAVFDYWAYYNNITRTLANTNYNLSQSDNVHYLQKEQFNRAGIMSHVLLDVPF